MIPTAFLGRNTWFISFTLILLIFIARPALKLIELTTSDDLSNVSSRFSELPLYFVENHGQLDRAVSHYIPGKDKTVYFTSTDVTYVFAKSQASTPNKDVDSFHRWTVKFEFLNSNEVMPQGRENADAIVSYFRGQPEQWTTAATVRKLRYQNLWSGVDLEYEGTRGFLKYNLYVAPFANPDLIRINVRGAQSVTLSDSGALLVRTPFGSLDDSPPLAWQTVDGQRHNIPVRFNLDQDGDSTTLSFSLGKYDRAFPLVIDPVVLVYAGFIGGAAGEGGISGPQHGIAIDAAGNAFLVGTTNSSETTFPATIGPDLTYNGNYDVYVAKVNASGTALLYAGYIGGASGNAGYAVAVDGSGAAYVTGSTNGGFGFPQIVGPDLTNAGGGDAFVAKVNIAGTALEYCGYIGGSGAELGYGIAVDSTGAAYVTGYTASTESTLPVVIGPDLTYNGGAFDIFVAKINPSGAGFDYLGYVGGDGDDIAHAIAVDTSGGVHITGSTSSSEVTFPVTTGSADVTYNGGATDAFFAKIASNGTNIEFASYLGGTGDEVGNAIAIDSARAIYITGETNSTETSFPVTAGSFDTSYNGGTSDAFIAKFNSTGSVLAFATYLGGNGFDYGQGIALNSSGDIYIVGGVQSSQATFPVYLGPDLTINGGADAFIARFTPDGSQRVYVGYIGGNSTDIGYGVAVDANGDAFVTGRVCSSETTFPVVAGPSLVNAGQCDDFVAKVNYVAPPQPNIHVTSTSINFGDVELTTNLIRTITVTNIGNSPLTLGTISFPVAPFFHSGGDCVDSVVLSDGMSCAIDIQFVPDAANVSTSSITIPSNDPDVGNGDEQNNVRISLVGAGVVAAKPNIDISTMDLDFGKINVDTLATKTLTVRNTGTKVLTLATIGTIVEPFRISGGSCSENLALNPEMSCTLQIQFVPKNVGSFSANLVVSSNDPDIGITNNQNNTTINLSGQGQIVDADLVLNLDNGNASYEPNVPYSYTYTTTNLGPTSATGVVLVDELSANVRFVSAAPTQGSCSGTNSVVCEFGTLRVGESAKVTMTIVPANKVNSGNAASISSNTPESNKSNNLVSIRSKTGGAELSVVVTSTPYPAIVGDRITYTITISNNGPLAATNVITETIFPNETIMHELASTRGSCSGGPTVICSLDGLEGGVLLPGAIATITIVVSRSTTDVLSQRTTVSSVQIDPDPTNNVFESASDVVQLRSFSASIGVVTILFLFVVLISKHKFATRRPI